MSFSWPEIVLTWQSTLSSETTKRLLNWNLYAVVTILIGLSLIFAVERMNRDYSISMLHDFIYGVIHTLIMVPAIMVVLVFQKTLIEKYLPGIQLNMIHQFSIPVQLFVALLVNDFLGYLAHYLRHKIAPLWCFHMTHHSQKHLNPFTTKRTHIVEHLFSKGLIKPIPLAVMGSPLEVWMLYYWITAFWDYFIHSNLKISFGPLRWIFVSPQYHRIHHSSLAEHRDKNFADKLVIWDVLFQTAYMNPREYPPTGVTDTSYPSDHSLRPTSMLATYASQWWYPFRRVWRLIRNKPVNVVP